MVRQRANLKILNEPEFHLQPDDSKIWDKLPREADARVERNLGEGFNAEWAMRDLFYIAYQHRSLLSSTAVQVLVNRLQAFGGKLVGNLLRSLPQEETRLGMEMAKYLLARGTSETN